MNGICPKYHGFCDDFGSVACGGDCAKCKNRAAANAMTLGDWERAYRTFVEETKRVRTSSMKSNIYALHSIMSTMGFAADQSMAVITRAVIQAFYAKADDLQPTTRKGKLESLQKMTSEAFCAWAEARGLNVVKMPSSRGLSGGYARYEQISDASMRVLRDIQWEYKQLSDPRKWLILTLALDYGMSKADILHAKWGDIFEKDGDILLVSYCRIKTGKRACWKVCDEHRREFAKAEKVMREMRRRHMAKDSKDFVLRCQHTGGATSSVWDEVNRELRARIIEWRDDSKALHNCRKEFATMVCRKHGWDVGEIATGDTAKILQKSYVGKLVIDWNNI